MQSSRDKFIEDTQEDEGIDLIFAQDMGCINHIAFIRDVLQTIEMEQYAYDSFGSIRINQGYLVQKSKMDEFGHERNEFGYSEKLMPEAIIMTATRLNSLQSNMVQFNINFPTKKDYILEPFKRALEILEEVKSETHCDSTVNHDLAIKRLGEELHGKNSAKPNQRDRTKQTKPKVDSQK